MEQQWLQLFPKQHIWEANGTWSNSNLIWI